MMDFYPPRSPLLQGSEWITLATWERLENVEKPQALCSDDPRAAGGAEQCSAA